MNNDVAKRPGCTVIYRPWITRNGKRIYRKNGGMFRLEVKSVRSAA